jgi:hypothetical protein
MACLAKVRRGGLYTRVLPESRVIAERAGGIESEQILLNRFYVRDSEREVTRSGYIYW